jgi:hypothetical protein
VEALAASVTWRGGLSGTEAVLIDVMRRVLRCSVVFASFPLTVLQRFHVQTLPSQETVGAGAGRDAAG